MLRSGPTDEEQTERRAASGGFRAGPRAASPPGRPPPLLLLLLLYHNALGLAFTLLKEHEYIIIHTKSRLLFMNYQPSQQQGSCFMKTQFHFSSNLITS